MTITTLSSREFNQGTGGAKQAARRGRCAKLHIADPGPARDTLVAATALVHRMTIVTRNIDDFEPTGVASLNP